MIMTFSVASLVENGGKLVFKPTQEFYASVKINRKRWGQIYRGEKEPVLSEIKAISQYFNIPTQAFFS